MKCNPHYFSCGIIYFAVECRNGSTINPLCLTRTRREMIWGLPQEREGRRPFKTSTKKIEWMLAAGRKKEEYTEKKKFYKTSKCRRCKKKLTWDNKIYDFDHKNNNSSNNSQNNCLLLCVECHRKLTKKETWRIVNTLTGEVVGHETRMAKVGIKKRKRPKTTRTKTKSTKRKSLKTKKVKRAKSKPLKRTGTKSKALRAKAKRSARTKSKSTKSRATKGKRRKPT